MQEGDEIEVDRLPQKEAEAIVFPEVLLVVDNGEVKIGQPTVEGTTIKAKIVSHLKGEKIRVARFKAKSRYRKVRGFRAFLTRIKIEEIGEGVKEKTAEKKPIKTSAQKTKTSPKRPRVI